MRVVGSSHADPYSATAAAAAPSTAPATAGANEAVIRMLTDIGHIDNVAAFVESVKSGSGGRSRLRHRCTRATTPGQDHQEDR